jgi:hypothetical protein
MSLNFPKTSQHIVQNHNCPYLATCDPIMVVPVVMLAEYGLKQENIQGIPYINTVPNITFKLCSRTCSSYRLH